MLLVQNSTKEKREGETERQRQREREKRESEKKEQNALITSYRNSSQLITASVTRNLLFPSQTRYGHLR